MRARIFLTLEANKNQYLIACALVQGYNSLMIGLHVLHKIPSLVSRSSHNSKTKLEQTDAHNLYTHAQSAFTVRCNYSADHNNYKCHVSISIIFEVL